MIRWPKNIVFLLMAVALMDFLLLRYLGNADRIFFARIAEMP